MFLHLWLLVNVPVVSVYCMLYYLNVNNLVGLQATFLSQSKPPPLSYTPPLFTVRVSIVASNYMLNHSSWEKGNAGCCKTTITTLDLYRFINPTIWWYATLTT